MVALQNKQNIVLEGGWPGGAGDSILTTRQATEEKYFILHVILINELRIYQGHNECHNEYSLSFTSKLHSCESFRVLYEV